MTDMTSLLRTIDNLSAEEFSQLYQHVRQRSRVTWWVVSPENLRQLEETLRPVHEEAALMSEEEINQVIDDALAEVRRERKQTPRRN